MSYKQKLFVKTYKIYYYIHKILFVKHRKRCYILHSRRWEAIGLDHRIGHCRPLRMTVSALERPGPAVLRCLCLRTEASGAADAMIEAHCEFVRNQCWPATCLIRHACKPEQTPVCKPSLFRSQATPGRVAPQGRPGAQASGRAVVEGWGGRGFKRDGTRSEVCLIPRLRARRPRDPARCRGLRRPNRTLLDENGQARKGVGRTPACHDVRCA